MDVNFKNQKVLVTGASGFLGGHIISKLIKQNANVVGIYHDLHKHTFIGVEGLNFQIDLAQANITDLTRMTKIISNYEIQYVFHCAANPIVRTCCTDPIGCFQTNIMGTASILEACRSVGSVKGIMCMESDKSYGSFDISDLPYKEDQALKPNNIYEVSKACAGYIARSYNHNYNIPTFTIRAANLYGPGDMNLSRLIPGSILHILNNLPPILYTGVENYIREFIFVEDAADIIIKLMQKIDEVRGHAINLGSGSMHRISDVIELICTTLNSNLHPEIVEKQLSFKEIEKQWLDLTKLYNFIPNFMPLSLEQGLIKTIKWYLKFNKLNTK